MSAFVILKSRYKTGTKCLASILLTALSILPVQAETNTASEQITQLSQQTLNEKAEQTGALLNATRTEAFITPPPDNLRLTPCDKALQISITSENHAGPQRLELRCESPNSWTIFIRGNIDVYANILTSSTQLNRGARPTPENIVFDERKISNLRRGYLTDYQQLENMTAARRIRAGEIIIPSMLEPEQIIQRGDQVNLIAGSGNTSSNAGSFFISMPGEAMNNGALHEQIRVRNIGSGRIVRGTIISRTEVRVE